MHGLIVIIYKSMLGDDRKPLNAAGCRSVIEDLETEQIRHHERAKAAERLLGKSRSHGFRRVK